MRTIPIITIDMGKNCSSCGKPGALEQNPAGLCLKCITKFMRRRKPQQVIYQPK